uniref:UmuC domain-containing protein n=1 Tax=Macrostomum lignano TaxID=282301 RepID=A0A1I8FP03_9PLAT
MRTAARQLGVLLPVVHKPCRTFCPGDVKAPQRRQSGLGRRGEAATRLLTKAAERLAQRLATYSESVTEAGGVGRAGAQLLAPGAPAACLVRRLNVDVDEADGGETSVAKSWRPHAG